MVMMYVVVIREVAGNTRIFFVRAVKGFIVSERGPYGSSLGKNIHLPPGPYKIFRDLSTSRITTRKRKRPPTTGANRLKAVKNFRAIGRTIKNQERFIAAQQFGVIMTPLSRD